MGRNGKVVIDDIIYIRDKIEKNLAGKELNAFIDSCAKELAGRLLSKVVKRTPVGKKPELKKGEKATFKVKGASGKTRSFLTADAERIQRYWSGYKGGTLRRGWTGGKDINASEIKGYANSLNVQHIGGNYNITITNPVEYASYVEYGHRQTPGRYVPQLGRRLKKGWIEGKFMLTDSEDELRREAPKALENKLKKKLEEIF